MYHHVLHRLCGRVPFQSDNPGKLEELIMQGELKFGEIEWINVSQAGISPCDTVLANFSARIEFCLRMGISHATYPGLP